MSDLFRTIQAPSEAVFTEQRSKFISFAFPIKTVEEAKEHVAALSKKYFDARHVCWAYMLGPERKEYRANDNGEPSGTAGKPILGQINSLELTDILVVVVRYFGGIKLGTSGLIVAYRTAARDALDAAVIIERHQTVSIEFTFPYQSINDVMKAIRQPGVDIGETVYDNTCRITLTVERDRENFLRERLGKIDGLTFSEQ